MLIGGLQRQGRVCRCTCNFFKGMSPQCISVFRIFGTDSWSKTIAGGAKTGQNKGTCWLVNLRTWPDQNLSISCKTKFGLYLIAQNLLGVQMGQMCAFWWKLRLHISCPNSPKDCPHLGVSENVVYPAIFIESDHQTLNSGFPHLPVQHCHHCLQFLWCLIRHVMSCHSSSPHFAGATRSIMSFMEMLSTCQGITELKKTCRILAEHQCIVAYCSILFGIVCHSSISFSHFQSLEIKNVSVSWN